VSFKRTGSILIGSKRGGREDHLISDVMSELGMRKVSQTELTRCSRGKTQTPENKSRREGTALLFERAPKFKLYRTFQARVQNQKQKLKEHKHGNKAE